MYYFVYVNPDLHTDSIVNYFQWKVFEFFLSVVTICMWSQTSHYLIQLSSKHSFKGGTAPADGELKHKSHSLSDLQEQCSDGIGIEIPIESKRFKHFLSFGITIKAQWNVSFNLNMSRFNFKKDIL